MDEQSIYLGIDAGGTSTTAVVVSQNGSVLGWGRGGAANHTILGLEIARVSISAAVTRALQGIHNEPAAVALGSAGLEETGDLEIARQLLPGFLQGKLIAFECDGLMALEGALGGDPGIVVVAGTGAIAYGRDASGKMKRAGGWGWRIGDEGSGYWIGRSALEAVTKAADGRGPETKLVTAIVHSLRLSNVEELVQWTYAKERAPRDIAALARVVDDAAREGDRIAADILSNAAAELVQAAQSVYLAQRQGLPERVGVSIGGGVFKSSLLLSEFRRRLEEGGWARWQEPKLSPALGAGLHAWRLGQSAREGGPSMWDVDIPESFVARLKDGASQLAPMEME